MADDPLIGWSTGSVRFEALLGRGAMGAVYRGVQLGLERPVAIKVIAPHLTEDPDYIARFGREAQTMGKLVHPHVVAAHDFGPCTGPGGERLYLMVLEFVDGWTLGHLAKIRRLSVRQVLELHLQAAEGLHAAHALGIIHRDIKPENIMVTRQGQAKLADFGLARSQADDAHLTAAGSILGSPAFMSPEACRGLDPTPASDIYSLGCSLMQVLTGAPVFAGTSALAVMQDHIAAPVPRIAPRRPDLAWLQPLLDRCLAKEPASRWPDAHALAKALAAAAVQAPRDLLAGRAQGTGATSGAPSMVTEHAPAATEMDVTLSTDRRPRPGLSRRALIAGVGVVIAVAAIAIVASADSPTADPAPGTVPPTEPRTPQHVAEASPPADPVRSEGPAPSPPVEPAPDPAMQADAVTLDQAQRLIGEGKLDEAERLLRPLLVTGRVMKERKSALDQRLAQAFDRRRQQLASAIAAARGRIAQQPRQAVTELEAITVPPRFDDLQRERDAALAQARTESGRPRPTPVPKPAGTAPAPAAAAAAIRLGHDEYEGGYAIDVAASLDRIPGPLPGGTLAVRESEYWEQRQTRTRRTAVTLRLPACTGGSDGVLLLVHGRRARDLLAAVAEEGGQTTMLAPIALGGSAYDVVQMRLPARAGTQRRMLLASDDPMLSFFVAAAAFAPGRLPTLAELGVVPGTLLPPLRAASLTEAIRAVRDERPDFPQFDRLRIGLPSALFRDEPERVERVLRALSVGFVDAGAAKPRQLTRALVQDYGSTSGGLQYLLDKAAGEHNRTHFYLHVMSTVKAPDGKPDICGQQMTNALTTKNLLPVLILTHHADAGDVRAAWQPWLERFRADAPGVPVIDLTQVPRLAAAAGAPIDVATPEGAEAVIAGLEAGLAELRARIARQPR